MKPYKVWWLNEAKDADMECGIFKTQKDAYDALPGIVKELLEECANNEEQEASILAGTLHLEYPRRDNEMRKHFELLDWPKVAP